MFFKECESCSFCYAYKVADLKSVQGAEFKALAERLLRVGRYEKREQPSRNGTSGGMAAARGIPRSYITSTTS
jgi:hypothetical protein